MIGARDYTKAHKRGLAAPLGVFARIFGDATLSEVAAIVGTACLIGGVVYGFGGGFLWSPLVAVISGMFVGGAWAGLSSKFHRNPLRLVLAEVYAIRQRVSVNPRRSRAVRVRVQVRK